MRASFAAREAFFRLAYLGSVKLQDEPFLVVGAVAEYRGACVNEDAVDACLAAARCSIIDAEAVGPPDACGDAIKGRVHRV